MENAETNPNYKFKNLLRMHIRSYRFAFRGLLSIFFQQLNFRIETIVGFIVLFLSLYFQISKIEWIIIIFTIFMVLIAESLNSAIEAVSDAVMKEKHPEIKFAKDVAAGAVLLAAILSVVIGLVIFIPYIF